MADVPREFIDVPACWERFRQDYEGVAWYGRTFAVDEAWRGRSVRLAFGAVNYLCEVYVNDEPIGYHEGGYTDFGFEVGDVLRYGEENTLLLRVIGPIITGNLRVDGIGRDDMPHWRGALTGGIWQSVELVARDPVHVADVFADPDLPGERVRVEAVVENIALCARQVTARVAVVPLGAGREPGAPKAGAPVACEEIVLTAQPGETPLALDLAMSSVEPWCPARPYLYRLDIELVENGTHPVVFGDNLLQYLTQMVTMFNAHLHPGELALGVFPVTPAPPVAPMTPPTPSLLSMKVKAG